MTMYRLHNDIFQKQYIKVDFKAMRQQVKGLKVGFAYKNESLTDRLSAAWEPAPITYISEVKRADAPDLSVWNACLIMSDQARVALSPLLLSYGEFLALEEGYHLYNCLCSAGGEVIDGDRSKFEIEFEDALAVPKKLVLNERNLPKSPLFKPGFADNTFFICGEEFKASIEAHGLTGLLFDMDLAQLFPRKPEP
ncbi:hypothetical protein [Teredinibacter turnerae]|uniref:hypothetical protein n=1 Tax=Teredinibacter turnerae TaxID=2426 RepID=UPI00048E3C1E|nr:hypothetical protein [Teredinibacter turnerae]